MSTMYYFDCDEITNSLISELDASSDRYRIEQEIAERNQLLCSIEDITGPSKRTQRLFKEVDALKKLLQTPESYFYKGSVDIDLS
jgi:hypothetical protein